MHRVKELFFFVYAKMFAKKIFFSFNKLLFQLGLRGMGILNYHSFSISGEKRFLEKVIPQLNDLPVLDVGANEGNYSAAILRVKETQKIYAFEPHPETYKRVSSRFSQSNVEVFNFGLGEKDQKLTLYDLSANSGAGTSHASFLQENIIELRDDAATEHQAEIRNLKKVLNTLKVSEVGLLKIDAEGYELTILQSIQDILDSGRIKVVHLEFNDINIIAQASFRIIAKCLTNFHIYRLLPTGFIRIDTMAPLYTELYAYQNLVAVHQSAGVSL